MDGPTEIYEQLNLCIFPERFCLEPRGRDGGLVSDTYLEIDRNTGKLGLIRNNDKPILIHDAEVKVIHGIVGIIKLVSGNALITITKANLKGVLTGHEIWTITETEIIPYEKTALHLTEKQIWYNRHFTDMIQLVLSTGGFYFSRTFDLSHSAQWLAENATPLFKRLPMMGRSDERFVWNRYLSAPLTAIPELFRYVLPIIHGFFDISRCIVNGHIFQLCLISRRSIYRAGTRFYMRGVSTIGHSANYVETEQLVEYDKDSDPKQRCLTSFVQIRGSIPLFWSQRPNLHWQPEPLLNPIDDQTEAFKRHMIMQRNIYGGKHVIVNLVNQKGREKRVGGELDRVVLRTNLDFVRLNAFDFHKECRTLDWGRLDMLKKQLRSEITEFGFFSSFLNSTEHMHKQKGFFRTNCMDCLDRTNVAQSMLAKESLKDQLSYMKIIGNGFEVDSYPELSATFKRIWADNGDECSRQYAGTGALKADYTRFGKRTFSGAWNDCINAFTRYFRNNFADGYRQDAINLFLGNFRVDPSNLPATFETTVLSFDYHGGAIVGAIFAAAMIILCILVAENMTATIFWFVVFMALMLFIFVNGEEFVNKPRLKMD
ncbi:Recessive suppressor of secretory defect, putative [Brugia malayi]|nr:Recessive suppressor of secretory defect, putative [Brugia malayi]VIO97219.1 Recessive suppressor of secretory defect, putative [Brugia malayi]